MAIDRKVCCFGFGLGGPRKSGPVDDWNPANQLIESLSHHFTVIHTSQVVQDAMNCILIMGMPSPKFLGMEGGNWVWSHHPFHCPQSALETLAAYHTWKRTQPHTKSSHKLRSQAPVPPPVLSAICEFEMPSVKDFCLPNSDTDIIAACTVGLRFSSFQCSFQNNDLQGQIAHLRHKPTNKAIQGLQAIKVCLTIMAQPTAPTQKVQSFASRNNSSRSTRERP